MTMMEKKLDAVIRYLLCETDAEQRQALRDLRELMVGEGKPVAVADWDVETEIRRLLLELGVPDHIKGHRYLVCALDFVIREPELLDEIVKGLYCRVADVFNTTKSRVERAIRHAIECAWDRGDLDVLKHYFGNTVRCTKGKPTNGEFIARVANELRQRV